MTDSEDTGAVEHGRPTVHSIVVLIGRSTELAEVHCFRPRVTCKYGVVAREAFRELELQCVVTAALAITFVENILGQTKLGEQWLPGSIRARSRNRCVKLPTSVEVASHVAHIGRAKRRVTEHLALDG